MDLVLKLLDSRPPPPLLIHLPWCAEPGQEGVDRAGQEEGCAEPGGGAEPGETPPPPCPTNALSNEHFRSDRILFWGANELRTE